MFFPQFHKPEIVQPIQFPTKIHFRFQTLYHLPGKKLLFLVRFCTCFCVKTHTSYKIVFLDYTAETNKKTAARIHTEMYELVQLSAVISILYFRYSIPYFWHFLTKVEWSTPQTAAALFLLPHSLIAFLIIRVSSCATASFNDCSP